MAKGFRQYTYKGWEVRASHYGDWECMPAFGEDFEAYDNFYNNEDIRFKTLKMAKDWVSTKEAQELKEKYMRG